jgi:hypothetical protein
VGLRTGSALNDYCYDVIKRDPPRGRHPSRLAYPKARFPLFADRRASGVHNIARAVVLDVFGATWVYALMLVRLWRTGLRVSRARHFPRDDPAFVQKIHDRERSV